MNADKARKRSFKARIKILYKEAIREIKLATKEGKTRTKINIIHCLEDKQGHDINEALKERLVSKGYNYGSSENHVKQNIFWYE